VECTIDNAFNLRDLILQEFVKIIVVFCIKDFRLKFNCSIFIQQAVKCIKDKVKLTGCLWGIQWLGFFLIKIW